MKLPSRPKVLVLGDHPVDDGPFVHRGLKLEPKTAEALNESDLNSASGVLLAAPSGKYGLIKSYFDSYFIKACGFGLITTILAPNSGDRAHVVGITDETCRHHGIITSPLGLSELAVQKPWIYLGETEEAIAENIARYSAGPPLGNALIRYDDAVQKLEEEDQILLRRAFHDCTHLRIQRLPGGKEARHTLQVFAKLKGENYGPQPMPFFVKIGKSPAIESEKTNYLLRAEPFIPFHLRPSLSRNRCVSGLTSSALVGDFVESAIPLRDALRDGHGAGAIFSLFEVTLRGLRIHTLNTAKKPGLIEKFIDAQANTKRIGEWPARIESAKKLGLTATPAELEKKIRTRAAGMTIREGLYHGDLHVGNVIVRHREAIVIDFGNMQDFGPLSADPAILEVSLAFGADHRDDPDAFQDWQHFINDIFINDPLTVPLQTGTHYRFAWLEKAIRELRHVVTCCGVTRDESLIVLCTCLLRFASHSPRQFKESKIAELSEQRRAYALVTAEQIFEKFPQPSHRKSKKSVGLTV